MPLSAEDQERYNRIDALNKRVALSNNRGAADELPAVDPPPSLPQPAQNDDKARYNQIAALVSRVALSNAADAAIPASTQRQPAQGDPLSYLRSPAETAARQTGGSLVDNLPPGVNSGQQVVAQPSRLIGGTIQDGIPRPTFQTDYSVYGDNGRQGTLSVTGPDRRAGGGTLSILDQGNGGTVEGNVAALNRQTEALRSLREARNPGITTGQAAGAFGDLVSIGKPGGGYGQEQLDANRSIGALPFGQPGDARRRKDMLALMGLQQQGQQFDAKQATEQQKMAMQQQAGILQNTQAAQTAAANRQWDQTKFWQQQGIAQQNLDLAQKNYELNAATKKPALSPYETTLQQETARQQVERAQQNRTGMADLQDTLTKVDKLHGMADTSGTFNSIAAIVGKPFNTEQAAQAEEFKSISNALAGSLIKSLGANPSNADLKFIQEEVSRLGNTPEGNRRILDNMRQFALQRAVQNGLDVKPLVERRGAALEQAGMPRDQVIETLRKEFAGAY